MSWEANNNDIDGASRGGRIGGVEVACLGESGDGASRPR
jgi:hypothetical protein